MSLMTIATNTTRYQMKVLAFSSPIYGEFASTQVRAAAVHFPIKFHQPDIVFDVVFRDEPEYEAFQNFVRMHQLTAQSKANLVTLNWPVRNINNWTGFIQHFEAGGKRFNVAPQARFDVGLVDSFMSSRAQSGTIAQNWQSIYGVGMPNGVLNFSQAEINLQQQIFGSVPGVNVGVTNPGSTQAPSGLPFPALPTILNGIITGTGIA